jgi:hypothetical protein
MKKITVKTDKIGKYKHLNKTQARVTGKEIIISEPTQIVNEEGVLLVHYDYIPKQINKSIHKELQQIKFIKSTRKSGLATESVIFGFSPRDMVKGLSCRLSKWHDAQKKIHNKFCHYAGEFDILYKKLFPELHKQHNQVLNKEILPCYRIPKTTYTSGIINKTNGLLYHTDNGNYKGYRSCMMYHEIGEISGGELSFPELNLLFKFQDSTYIFFDGATLLHGVCPIKKTHKSERYTTVFYTLEGLKQGLEPVEEMKYMESRNHVKFLTKDT